MLLKQKTLHAIADGDVTLAFRRWKRPTVKSGGTLRTPMGVLAIQSVDVVNENNITKQDAQQAGYESRQTLLAELNVRQEGLLYRIALHFAGSDPRTTLRQQTDFSNDDIDDLKKRLQKMDSRSQHGPWTSNVLQLIHESPGTRAAELADSLEMETQRFKTNVRKLKELGLTESLQVGYRLSPRGESLLKRI